MYLAATCEDYRARIIIDDEETYYSDQSFQDMTYYIENELAVGRIELCSGGKWSPICEDFWTSKDASVACHQLGFSRAGNEIYYHFHFSFLCFMSLI